MLAPSFAPGQRWISNTESELGLGVIEGFDVRRVTVSFPAADEQRVYAADNAPLTRVLYPLGELVTTVDGRRITITKRSEHGLLLRYTGADADGVVHIIDEAQLDSFARFSRPQDRLLAGQLDPNDHFVQRVRTLEHRNRQRCAPAYGLLGARVALLPHQMFIASEVSARYAPRVLLADEVGLGKTIEAGLIVHQQLLSGRASRVLFVVPDALLHQWLVEMLRRFNLRVTILDEQRCAALEGRDDVDDDSSDSYGYGDGRLGSDHEGSDSNPFDTAQLVLCPLSMFAEQSRRLQQAVVAGWDLLVIDEAHHLQWSEDSVSSAYSAVEALANCVPGLLLLTATPEQLGAQGHFARLRLLDPDRYPDAARFRAEESGYQAISALVQKLTDGVTLGETTSAMAIMTEVEGYLGGEVAGSLRASLGGAQAQLVIDEVVRALLDRHGTGRVLFRNTRNAVGGFPRRRVMAQQLSPAELGRSAGVLDADSDAGAGADPMQCMLNPLRELGEDWVRHDARVAWLEAFLRKHRDRRTLIICARADTARSLEEHLRVRGGLRTAVFHEETSILVRDRAAAYFTEPGADGAQALVCSEIGSEGRNFQHASELVLFDLPLDPDLLEQRIGRLDRIGQRHEVQIHVPYWQGSPQQVLLRWYHDGLDAFERPCAIGGRMREQFCGQLAECLAQPALGARLDTLIADTRVAAQDLLRDLEQGRDRLLELGSCDPQRAAQAVEAVVDATHRTDLATYMEGVFDLFGVEHEDSGAQSIIIRPGNHMLCDEFPQLAEDGMTATFEREQALAREDMAFLTWEHPMVVGAMELLLDGEIGNATLCTLKSLPLKAGTLLLESIFVVHCPGPRALDLNRYLSMDVVRNVVSSEGHDLSEVLGAQVLDQRAAPVQQDTARELVRHAWTEIEKMVAHGQRLATDGQASLIDTAVENARQRHAVELERLRALAEVNPNIRAEEISHLQSNAQQVCEHLAGAQLRLDAIRVGIVI